MHVRSKQALPYQWVRSLPILLAALCAPARGENLDAQSVAAGAFHFCAIVGGGSQCWGDNFDGQLGDGSFLDKVTPVPVAGLQSGVTAIAGGSYHTCAIVNGGVKCWGFNGDGELGNGSLASSGVPVAVQGLASGVIAIGTGAIPHLRRDQRRRRALLGLEFRGPARQQHDQRDQHQSAGQRDRHRIRRHGARRRRRAHLRARLRQRQVLGQHAWGQLDDGSLSTRYAPVAAAALTGIVAISAGRAHNCAIQNDGGVRCWGRNDHGQLGNGSYWPSSRRTGLRRAPR